MPQNNQLTEKDIALDLMTSSKSEITTLTKVLTETTNSELRNTLMNELTACVNSHHRLSDISINKGWYNAHETPDKQLQQDLSCINEITQ
ncbi:spore coat protein [Clostridium sp. C2-6-12]|uniref:spore coat protein n=1 Tax=Clostridium sp. C2-6-12 TaxID=2698832 RepID=UPI001368CE59|nr:spore coat protein [Clostridium sp. C2-6-12]